MSTSCSQNINTQTLLVPLVAKKKTRKNEQKRERENKKKKTTRPVNPKISTQKYQLWSQKIETLAQD